ncbi:MAG: hypothetical protein R3C49_17715 [Planctomycetaceae bacterium]
MNCRSCGRVLQGSPASTASIRHAREIVARWSSSDLLDRIAALPELPPFRTSISARSGQGDSREVQKEEAETFPSPEQDFGAKDQTELIDSTAEIDTRIPGGKSSDSPEFANPLPVEALKTPTHQDRRDSAQHPANRDEPAGNVARKDPLPSSGLQQHSEAEGSSVRVAESIRDQLAPGEPPLKAVPDRTQKRDVASDRNDFELQDQFQRPTKSAGPELSQREIRNVPDSSRRQGPAVGTERSKAESTAPELPINTQAGSEPAPPGFRERPRKAAQRSNVSRTPFARTAPQQGSNTVTRKFRVDSPGDESQEQSAAASPATNVAGGKIQSNSKAGGRRHRIDDGQDVGEMLQTGDSRTRTQTRPRRRYIDEPHGNGVRGPHFQVTAPRRSNLTSITGQFLAYVGVLGLTIGTAMVIYGHFGGYSEYTPTGWLVTTVAQMMLFLGVINLVSGGIEQNNDDVSTRINTLSEQLIRIEQVTEAALRGPKISARRYADPNALIEEGEHEKVTVGRDQ